MNVFAAPRSRWASVAVAVVALALAALLPAHAGAFASVECQHPVGTGVEVFKLHDISSRRACPVALALYRWENSDDHGAELYGCHGIAHPFLRMHEFDGWHLSLTPYFQMSRAGSSFAVEGTDFPLNCS